MVVLSGTSLADSLLPCKHKIADLDSISVFN